MKMTVNSIREYLRDKINNSWYANAQIDCGVAGRFLDVQTYGEQGQHLYILWEEEGKRYKMPVSWWAEYSAGQLYNIWMECAGDEDTEELPGVPSGKKGWDIPSITESLAADVTSGKITLHDAAVELYRANSLTFIDTEKAAELLGLPSNGPQPSGTQSIKFFWNGIKINGEKKLVKCFYSLDNSCNVSGPCVSISAQDLYHLPGDLFAVRNDTDPYTDYSDSDHAVLEPSHPLYPYARAAALKSAIRDLERWPGTTGIARAARALKLERCRAELAALPASQPAAADMEAVRAMNLAAETARLAAQKEARQKALEATLAARREGRRYIEQTAAAHPITEGAPVVTILWSESAAFSSWADGELTLSVAAAEIVLEHFDRQRAEENCGGYDKTAFRIDYTGADGEPGSYEGRYDLGGKEGGLIAHLRAFSEYTGQPGFCQDEAAAAEARAFTGFLETHTARGRVVSVSIAPWVQNALETRRAAQEELCGAAEMLTDEQLCATVMQIPHNDPKKTDVARFFLQQLMRRDEKKALDLFRRWKRGEPLASF